MSTTRPDPTDELLTQDIVRAINGGDQSAFDELFQRVGGRVFVYIENRMGQRLRELTSADDVLQEVYLQAFESFGAFVDDGPGSMGRWLVGIARNQIRRLYKHHFAYAKRCASRAVRLEATPSGVNVLDRATAGVPTPSAIVSRDESVRRVARAVASLDAADRQLILLYAYEGLSLEKIGERTNTPRTTLSYRLARALERIESDVA